VTSSTIRIPTSFHTASQVVRCYHSRSGSLNKTTKSDIIVAMNNTDVYRAKVYCANCDFREEMDIQKGKKINDTACPKCGTAELNKDTDVVMQQGYYFDNGYGL